MTMKVIMKELACRVPLRLRGAQQRITPDVQTGCISCASGDGKFGGPVWWNTPLDDDDAPETEHRSTWTQASLISWFLLLHGPF